MPAGQWAHTGGQGHAQAHQRFSMTLEWPWDKGWFPELNAPRAILVILPISLLIQEDIFGHFLNEWCIYIGSHTFWDPIKKVIFSCVVTFLTSNKVRISSFIGIKSIRWNWGDQKSGLCHLLVILLWTSHFTSSGFNFINQQQDAENIYWVPVMGQILC